MKMLKKQYVWIILFFSFLAPIYGQTDEPPGEPPYLSWGPFIYDFYNHQLSPDGQGPGTWEWIIRGLSEEVEHVQIPATIDSSPVTAIRKSAFSGDHYIKSVSIPDTITNIGNGAFQNCSNLQEIDIPDSVTELGSGVFAGCSSLTRVSGNVSLAESIFEGCINLSDIEIPSDIVTIEQNCFKDCTALESIHLPQGLLSIEEGAFYNCSSLVSVTVPQSVEHIGTLAFASCDNLMAINIAPDNPVYSSLGGVMFNKDLTELLMFPEGVGSTFTVPYGVTSIGDYAFAGNKTLTQITLGNSVQKVGSYAFSKCTALTDVGFPESPFELGFSSFAECTSLTDIEIPGTLESIPYRAFEGCQELQNLFIGDGVTYIAAQAFIDCDSLTTLIIPDSVEAIEAAAFENCSKLSRVFIGSGTVDLGILDWDDGGGIWDDDGLWAHMWPYEGPGTVFPACYQLQEILVSTENPVYASLEGVLFSKDYSRLLTYPRGSDGVYHIPEGVTRLAAFSFYDCPKLTEVVIPDSVSSIGSHAFVSSDNLSKVIIGSGLETLGQIFIYYDWYFNFTLGCPNLKSILFLGEPPDRDSEFNLSSCHPDLTIYYLEGTPGWGPAYAGRPTQPVASWGPYYVYETAEHSYSDTGNWMGILEITHDPWIWCDTVSCWFNIPEKTASVGNGWVYPSNEDNLLIVQIDGTNWGYSFASDKWLYLTASGWVYMM